MLLQLLAHCFCRPDVVHDSKATMTSFMEGYVANLEPCTVVIQRRRILSSVFRAVKHPDFNFHRPVTVVFSGEDATDEGGPKREFFRLKCLLYSYVLYRAFS